MTRFALAEVFSLHTRQSRSGQTDERSYFFDTLEEYQWARDAAGLMPSSIDQLVKPVIELCEHYDIVPRRRWTVLHRSEQAGPVDGLPKSPSTVPGRGRAGRLLAALR